MARVRTGSRATGGRHRLHLALVADATDATLKSRETLALWYTSACYRNQDDLLATLREFSPTLSVVIPVHEHLSSGLRRIPPFSGYALSEGSVLD